MRGVAAGFDLTLRRRTAPGPRLTRRRSGGLRDQILPGRDDQRLDQVAYGAALERDRRGITHRLVDDIESHRDSGAVLAIGMGQPDRGAQRDARQRRRPDRAHARGVEEPVGHDRDDAPARPHTLDRRLQVADRSERVGTAAERAREGRVHQDEAGALRGCHDAGDLRAVVAGNAGFREGGRALAARGIDLAEPSAAIGGRPATRRPLPALGSSTMSSARAFASMTVIGEDRWSRIAASRSAPRCARSG